MKIISALLLLGGIAAADDQKPCKKIEAACTAAGFAKGGAKTGKGLFKDCMKPIMDGQTVAGVTVDAADVTACKTRIDAHKKAPPPSGGGDAPPAQPAPAK